MKASHLTAFLLPPICLRQELEAKTTMSYQAAVSLLATLSTTERGEALSDLIARLKKQAGTWDKVLQVRVLP